MGLTSMAATAIAYATKYYTKRVQELNSLHMNGLPANLECRCSLLMRILHGRKEL